MTDLRSRIERSFSDSTTDSAVSMAAFTELREGLENGTIRSADPDSASLTGWRVNAWVKQGILLGFRLGQLEKMGDNHFSFVDKSTYPVRRLGLQEGVRVVP